MDLSVLRSVVAPHEAIGWAAMGVVAVWTLASTLFQKKKERQFDAGLHRDKAALDAQSQRRVETHDTVRLLWRASQGACARRQVERAPLHELTVVADQLSSLVAEHEPHAPAEVVVLVRQLSETLDGLYTPDVDCRVQLIKERLLQTVRYCLGNGAGGKVEVAR